MSRVPALRGPRVLTAAAPAVIVWRIRRINRGTAAHVTQRTTHRAPRTRLEHVVRIVVEAGMLYTLFVVLTFVTELAGSNAVYGVSDMVRPRSAPGTIAPRLTPPRPQMVVVVGISFNLIIIRVDSAAAAAAGSSLAESAPPTSYPLHFMRSSVTTAPGRGVEVVISRDVDRVSEGGKHESVVLKADERGRWADM